MTANGAAVPLSVIAGMRKVSIGAALLLISFASGAQEPPSMSLPIFDAHIHYSHDAWQSVPPQEAIAILRKAGVRRALVSSSGDDGQQKLHALAPDLIVPSLRPYRSRGDISTWVRDPSVIAYLEERLKRYRYAAIGEFHVYGADADLPVVRRVVELAKQHRIFLHSHSDADAIERHFRQDPDARILWAHSGFDRPERVREMLRKHKNLWCDLAFRTDQARGGKVDPDWRAAFLEFPDRFMVGTDSFTPERWHYIAEHANWSRQWLGDLPKDVAEQIAWKNGERLFGGLLAQ
jgi:predicted TIM-barrel fold metal-dependent hydrolase